LIQKKNNQKMNTKTELRGRRELTTSGKYLKKVKQKAEGRGRKKGLSQGAGTLGENRRAVPGRKGGGSNTRMDSSKRKQSVP